MIDEPVFTLEQAGGLLVGAVTVFSAVVLAFYMWMRVRLRA